MRTPAAGPSTRAATARQVSTGGGCYPRWRADGRELLARVGAGDLEETEIKALQELFVGSGAVAEIELDRGDVLR